MITLDKTTRKLQLLLAGAAATEAEIVVVFYDVLPQTKATFEEYRRAVKVSNSNDTTPVDICDSPVIQGTTRNITLISVFNADVGSITATVRYNDNGTLYRLKTHAIPTLQTLRWTPETDWAVS